MWKAKDGSTARLIQLCAGYFTFYVITGLTVKYFLGKPSMGLPGMNGIAFLVYSTVAATSLCIAVVLALRWFTLETIRPIQIGPLSVPSELLYIVPSGVCTGVIIPTTTLMYTLPISVMVAMVIMRGSVIVISRLVDTVQIRQGILTKKVYWSENVAVIFALGAVGAHLLAPGSGKFDFLNDAAAIGILSSYLTAYSIRIYIMNYYKNTAGKGVKRDNRAFFGIEQISASLTLVVAGVAFFNAPAWFGYEVVQVTQFRAAILDPNPLWLWAGLAGSAFGLVAFFSVFIFMYKGRTATFAGLVNRLTSLLAGTTATLLFWGFFGGKFPETKDWVSLVFILVAVGFLTMAERQRARELEAEA